ncbi:redoxin domain-containing protein [Paenibacillus chondroitinus]|uniref:Redoxin domain-containing protein n=1 Tax=Paenibacillus chondroitinus TaxID=59842 RepID=A0ABU6DGF7_9BACL|nr:MULTISPECIES: redoxin domain-containing protein [Paenibacillus]MCY9659443.1 redoxin domain-containing protein [Paenibacillus anseongense]MEB4796838.1 redoxin domain-containing protein [Paenibacillus chondroitinus]
MAKNRRWIQISIFLVVFILLLLTIVQGVLNRDKAVIAGTAAPEFSLLGLDGKVHNLSDYNNKTVVLNFWGTFCPPCRAEMPAIQKQYDKWKGNGLIVLGVNLGEANVTAQNFVDQYKLTFPILLDPKLRVRDLYKVTQYPTTFFIRNGAIQEVRIGQMDEPFLENTIDKLMKDK